MILIGTSGSTKCDWQLLREGETFKAFSSHGINPFVYNEEDIYHFILDVEELKPHWLEVEQVFLYSAGCATKELRYVVKRALERIFLKAHNFVNHDIVGAALATYEGRSAITCILGTGSNACFFDGDIVRQEVPALDYILGDEGSGSYYGKKLLNMYLYRQLPEHIHRAFEKEYSLSTFEILDNVYRKPFANVYLASFMKFIQTHREEAFFHDMIHQGMKDFMTIYVTRYSHYRDLETNFIGSIAYFFQDSLHAAANELDIKVGKIIKEPIEGLVQYHLKKYFQKS